MGFLGEPHWGGTMQGNEVVDLNKYRSSETSDTTSDEAGLQFLPAGTKLLLGQYTIDGYLNCGGFGITYTATDSLQRKVVVKECFPGELAYRTGACMAPRSPKYRSELETIVQHFVEEAHRLANMCHDGIVHVHQIFEENDTAYMAMDFIDGPDLLDVVDTSKLRLGPGAVQDLTRKMLSAIKHVHDHGMLHRDISPDNILIAPGGDPVLIDFGAAREKTQQKQRALSKLKFVNDGYSPQEVYIAGSEQGPWSDLYSFAASMYHVITGEAPIGGQARLGALAAKKPDPYVPLANTVTGYPKGFLAAIDKALEVIPENRLQSADEWLARLPELEPDKSLPLTFALATGDVSITRHAKLAGGAIAAGLAILALSLSGLFGPAPTQPAPLTELSLLGEPALGHAPAMTTRTDSSPSRRIAALPAAFPPSPFGTQTEPSPRVVSEAPALFQHVPPQGAIALAGDMTDRSPNVLAPSQFPPVKSTSAPVAQAYANAGLQSPIIETVGPLPAKANEPGKSLMNSVLVSPTAVQNQVVKAATDPLPEVAGPLTDIKTVMLSAQTPTAHPIEAPPSKPVARGREIAALPPLQTERRVTADTTPPNFFVQPGRVLPSQITFSHWDVDMPFASRTERVRSANTIVITDVSDTADLSISGNWIAEGVILYSFNGEPLQQDTPLLVSVLNNLTVDPDGYTRSTVRYRDPAKDILDRALMAVPVVREIGLADGTILETRRESLNWVTRVVTVGMPESGLALGDILRAEDQTGIVFASHEDVEKALGKLADQKSETARLTVLRNGARQLLDWPLARED